MQVFLEMFPGKLAATAIMSMLPVVELRGGIPYGTALGLAPWAAFAAAVVGNMLPLPFIILLVRQVFNWLRRGPLGAMIGKLEKRAHLKGRLVRKYRLIGLTVLVAIPLPGTGAWTGALVAALLEIRMRHALPAILLGLVIAGGITTAVTLGLIHLF